MLKKFKKKIEEQDKSVDLKFLNEEIRGDTDLVEEISDSYDKYQEKIKRTETKSAPKKQLERSY